MHAKSLNRIVLVVFVSCGLMTSCGSTGTGNNQVDTECEAGFLNECEEPAAAKSVKWSDVACRWEGRDVVIEATAKSDFNATLDVSLIPRYEIEKGGQHGTAAFSQEHKKLSPHESVTFRINAGHPKGVPTGTRIAKCNPKVYDVELAG